MSARSAEELSDELNRLMKEQIDSLQRLTFGVVDREEFGLQEARLKRIREVSAELLVALKRNQR